MNAIFIDVQYMVKEYAWLGGAVYNKDTIQFLKNFSKTVSFILIHEYEELNTVIHKTNLKGIKNLEHFTELKYLYGLITGLEIKYYINKYNIDKFAIIANFNYFDNYSDDYNKHIIKLGESGCLSDESKQKIIKLLK